MFLINASRRRFIKLSIAILLLPFFPLSADDHGEMSLFVNRGGTDHNIVFMRDGEIIEEGYFQLCHIFKDMRADVAVKMDIELFKILSEGQKWLASYGYTSPIVITSAYRTIETNMCTEGAAQNSLHLYGKAADIKYPGVPVQYLAILFRTYGASGIGIYSSFLHIDTWKERVWRG